MSVFVIVAAVAALGVGVWIGIGAPGWPHKPRYHRQHGEQRSINPIAWGRTPSRERQRARTRDERRGPRLR